MGNCNIHTTFNRLQVELEKDLHWDGKDWVPHPHVQAIAEKVDELHHNYMDILPEVRGSQPRILDEGNPCDESYDPLTLLHLMDMDGGPLVRKVTLTYDPDACTISIHREDCLDPPYNPADALHDELIDAGDYYHRED